MGSEDQALTVHSKSHSKSNKRRSIAPEVSTLTKITLEKICLESDVIHVTRKDTMIENVLETKMYLTRRRETREDIMLMLRRMMNLP